MTVSLSWFGLAKLEFYCVGFGFVVFIFFVQTPINCFSPLIYYLLHSPNDICFLHRKRSTERHSVAFRLIIRGKTIQFSIKKPRIEFNYFWCYHIFQTPMIRAWEVGRDRERVKIISKYLHETVTNGINIDTHCIAFLSYSFLFWLSLWCPFSYSSFLFLSLLWF